MKRTRYISGKPDKPVPRHTTPPLSKPERERAIAYGFSSGQLSLKPSAGHAIETVLRNKSKTKLG